MGKEMEREEKRLYRGYVLKVLQYVQNRHMRVWGLGVERRRASRVDIAQQHGHAILGMGYTRYQV